MDTIEDVIEIVDGGDDEPTEPPEQTKGSCESPPMSITEFLFGIEEEEEENNMPEPVVSDSAEIDTQFAQRTYCWGQYCGGGTVHVNMIWEISPCFINYGIFAYSDANIDDGGMRFSGKIVYDGEEQFLRFIGTENSIPRGYTANDTIFFTNEYIPKSASLVVKFEGYGTDDATGSPCLITDPEKVTIDLLTGGRVYDSGCDGGDFLDNFAGWVSGLGNEPRPW